MPTQKDDTISFKNYQNKLKVPWVVYADFESLVEKVYGCQPSLAESHATKSERHTACGFSLLAVLADRETIGPYVYRSQGAVKAFFYYLQLLEKDLRKGLVKKRLHKKVTREDWRSFNDADDCHICGQDLYKEN